MKRKQLYREIYARRTKALMLGDIDAFVKCLEVVLGKKPTICLFCTTDVSSQHGNDIDRWFCEKHCPACNAY